MNTIKSNSSIDLIFKFGQKQFLPFLSVVVFNDKENQIAGQVAFIAGKKHGNAVWRNKAKRILREVYKKINIDKNKKLLLIANKKTTEVNQQEIVKGLQEILNV